MTTASAVPGAHCLPSVSIKPPSAHLSATASLHCDDGAVRYQSSMRQMPKQGKSFSSGSDDDVDASELCPHYDEHHRGRHYKQYLRQKSAEAHTIKESSHPPLWRVPIVRQPLPVSIEEFNSAEPQYTRFVKALWSHARATVEDKEAAQDFAQSPVGQDSVPQRCRDLDEAGWRRRELLQHSWDDRPGAVGRPLSPTIIRQGPSWLVDAEGYEGPFGSPGDLRSKGMAYNSRFQLPTLSSLMKAKHAVFVKAKDPRQAQMVYERKSMSARRCRQTQRWGAGRCRSSPPQVNSPTSTPGNLPMRHQPQQLSPAAPSPSLLNPPAPLLSPNACVRAGQSGSPRGSLPCSPRTSAPPSPAGSPKNRPTERSPRSPLNQQNEGQSAGEGTWTVHIRGKGKCQYPESYIRWKRERKRMRERLKRLRAGEIFTGDRPKESCADCESPSLCWDPQPLTEHLHAVRSFGSAPEDDASSGTDLSSSSQRSSSISTSNSDGSSRSCSPSREDNSTHKYKLRIPAYGNSFPSAPCMAAGAALVAPSPLYPFAGLAPGVAVGSYVHAPSGPPVLHGALRPLQSSLHPGKPLGLGNSMQQHPPWLVLMPTIAGTALMRAQTSFVLPSLQKQQILMGQQQVQQGQMLLQQLQHQTLLQQQIPRSYMAVQLPAQSSQSVTFEQSQQQQQQQPPMSCGVQQGAQKRESTKMGDQQKREQLSSKPWEGFANSRGSREEWSRKEAPFFRLKEHNGSGRPHVRYVSAPPPARRHTGKEDREHALPSSHASAAQLTLSPAASPATGAGCNMVKQALPQTLLTQPIVTGPSHPLFGIPQSLSAGPGVVQGVAQGVPVAAILRGSPLLVSSGTHLMAETPQQIHPGGPCVFSGAERLQRRQPKDAAAVSHRSASCSPTAPPVVVAQLPVLPLQHTPVVVQQLRQQPLLTQQQQQQLTIIQQQQHPLLIQKQPLVVQRQQQQPLVVQQQQQQPIATQQLQPVAMNHTQQSPQQSAGGLLQLQPDATVVIQQQQPGIVVQQPPIITPEERKPAAALTPEKPKTHWLWSCNIDCGANCGGRSPAASHVAVQEQPPAVQPDCREKHQPKQRLQHTQAEQRASPEEASGKAPSSLTPTAAPVPPAESRVSATAQQVHHLSQQPSGSDGTREAMQGVSQACQYLQPPQQQLQRLSPRKQQQPQEQQKVRTPTALSTSSPIAFVPTAPGTQNIVAPSAAVACMESQQIQQHQQPPQQCRQSSCCKPHRGGAVAEQEPPFKFLPFTFISPKRNIACGMGKKVTFRERTTTASSPMHQQKHQQQERQSCCGRTGGELSASVSCSI